MLDSRFTVRLLVISHLICALPIPSAAEGRKLAVVVGVDKYRANSDLPLLKHAGSDAALLSAALRSQGYTVFEMTQAIARHPDHEESSPQLAYIRDKIKGVLGTPNLGEEDAVIIALHGHGVQFDATDDQGNVIPRFYFCPADAMVAGIKKAADLSELNYLLPLDELYQELGDCKAGTKLLIVDACRNDPGRSNIFKSSLASATLPKVAAPPGGTAAFFSCKANQRAIEDTQTVEGKPILNQGVFTHFLVEGLNGAADQPLASSPPDGVVTFAELSTYVANNTYAHVFNKYGVKQSPELRGDYDLNLPLARVAPAIEATSEPGEIRSIGSMKIRMCWCPAAKAPEPAGSRLRRAEIERGFWLGETEVTQRQWTLRMDSAPWHGKQGVREGDDYPATYIDWNSAQRFCNLLNSHERSARQLPEDWCYRLPTEAEWEYAALAGRQGSYGFGDETSTLAQYAWFRDNTASKGERFAHAVGLKRPNVWNLCDMHGNVWEWCDSADAVKPYRGGSWLYPAERCTATVRGEYDSEDRFNDLGIRIGLFHHKAKAEETP